MVLTNLINLKSNLFKSASNTFFPASLVYLILQQILPRIEIRSYIKVHIFFELFSSTDFADAKIQLKPNSITILDYAEALWEKGVDPNVPVDDYPILRAAKEGHSEILDLFAGSKPGNAEAVLFEVRTENKENILHLILKKYWLAILDDARGTVPEKSGYEKRFDIFTLL